MNPPSTPAVALLLFNRPELTQRVVDEVVAANPNDVYLIADGPRPDHPDDERLCEEVRHIATQALWTGTVHTDFSAQNLGLKRRVSTGLDWVFDHEEQAIILEDDCLPDPSFFRFAEELLDRYKTDERVGMISGNNFLWGAAISPDSYFFSPDVRIWGWATWRRVWRGFSETGLDKSRSRSEVANLLTAITSPTRNRLLARIQRTPRRFLGPTLPFALSRAGIRQSHPSSQFGHQYWIWWGFNPHGIRKLHRAGAARVTFFSAYSPRPGGSGRRTRPARVPGALETLGDFSASSPT